MRADESMFAVYENGVEYDCDIEVLFETPAQHLIADNEEGIIVDKNAKRFMNEPALEGHAGLLAVDLWDTRNMLFPRIPGYMIFDDEMRKMAPFGWLDGLGCPGCCVPVERRQHGRDREGLDSHG